MNYQELESIWADSDEDLDQQITINQPLINEITMKKIKSNLFETRLDILLELILTIPFLKLFKDFCLHHWYEPKFLLPGLFLLGLSMFTILFASYKLYLLSRVNRSYPILKSQRNLTLIQYFNRMEINTLLFLIPTFSLAFLLVAAKGIIGLDLYLIHFPFIPYLIGSFLVGLIIILFLKLFPDKKLAKAITFLEDLKKME